ncbi:methylenetetrahydrofolate reductase [Marinomonas fungiae]|uniref:methylenetetrahydrofolate reductase n=1 Tax=Marinomonas fungiae TaxID=1137284 RepID=UPI003A8F0754
MFSLPPFSLETTGKSAHELASVADLFAARTPVNIAFLGNESHAQRIQAAATIKSLGLEPTPIISSRRLQSEEDFYHYVDPLLKQSHIKRLMVVGGDPKQPQGPYNDSIGLLKSDLLKSCELETVVIAGYPEGHPHIRSQQLIESLKWKVAFLKQQNVKVEITTQLAFCTESIVKWIETIRSSGIHEPIRIGVPSSTRVKTLRYFAQQFGVEISAASLEKYAMDTTDEALEAKTDALYQELTQTIKQQGYENIYFHLYTLDGMVKSKAWLEGFLRP